MKVRNLNTVPFLCLPLEVLLILFLPICPLQPLLSSPQNEYLNNCAVSSNYISIVCGIIYFQFSKFLLLWMQYFLTFLLYVFIRYSEHVEAILASKIHRTKKWNYFPDVIISPHSQSSKFWYKIFFRTLITDLH